MNVFEFALQFEKDGEKFYRELATEVSHQGLLSLINRLAEEEVKHYQVVQQIANSEPLRLDSTPILAKAKNVFQQMKDSGEEFEPNMAPEDLLKKAQELEKQSEDFYREKMTELDSSDQKQAFGILADQEKAHYQLLENIIAFLQQPQSYLADAEFGKIEEL